MALWECGECTTRYAVGAPACPHCGSDLRVNEKTQPPEEDEMAKITVHGGASDALAGLADGEYVLSAEAVKVAADVSEESADGSSEAAAEEPEKAPRQRRTRSK
jgi:hypothetical protein